MKITRSSIQSFRNYSRGLKRGKESERKTEIALNAMIQRGDIIGFCNVTHMGLDKRGVDFVVIKKPLVGIPLQVRSSKKGGKDHQKITNEVFKSKNLKGVSMSISIPGTGQVSVDLSQKIPVVIAFEKYRCYELIQEISKAIDEFV